MRMRNCPCKKASVQWGHHISALWSLLGTLRHYGWQTEDTIFWISFRNLSSKTYISTIDDKTNLSGCLPETKQTTVQYFKTINSHTVVQYTSFNVKPTKMLSDPVAEAFGLIHRHLRVKISAVWGHHTGTRIEHYLFEAKVQFVQSQSVYWHMTVRVEVERQN